MKILLANGCACSEPKVYPANWKTTSARTNLTWFIHYRFYDPTVPRPKQVKIKGMNSVSDLKQRQAVTRDLLAQELKLLKEQDYNPVTGSMAEESEEPTDYIIHPDTPFVKAITEGVKNLQGEPATKRDAANVVKHISTAARQLRLDQKPVNQVERRHLIAILNQCGKNKGKKWTANNFNVYRANLLMIYKKLIELQTVGVNPVRDISKQKVVVKIRETLTKEQREPIIAYLKEHKYRFWIYTNIFFHSAGRTTELFRLTGKDVDLSNQRFKIVIKKGRDSIEQWRPIKNIAKSFWELALTDCGADDFIFSRGLKPGPKKIRADQITKRWYVIKEKFKIDVDFYAFKHANLDETARVLSIKQAQKMAGHKSDKTTRIYTIGQEGRENEELKGVNNPL